MVRAQGAALQIKHNAILRLSFDKSALAGVSDGESVHESEGSWIFRTELAGTGRNQLTFKVLYFGVVRLPYQNPDEMIFGLKRCGIIRAEDTTLSVDRRPRQALGLRLRVPRDTEPIPSGT